MANGKLATTVPAEGLDYIVYFSSLTVRNSQ